MTSAPQHRCGAIPRERCRGLLCAHQGAVAHSPVFSVPAPNPHPCRDLSLSFLSHAGAGVIGGALDCVLLISSCICVRPFTLLYVCCLCACRALCGRRVGLHAQEGAPDRHSIMQHDS